MNTLPARLDYSRGFCEARLGFSRVARPEERSVTGTYDLRERSFDQPMSVVIGPAKNLAHRTYTLPISMDRPGYKGRGAPDIHILHLNGKTLMPYHRYPNRGSRPTAGPATCLGSEALVTGGIGFTQVFG